MAIICLNVSPLMAQFTSQQATNLVLNDVLSGELDNVDVFMMDEAQSGQSTVFLGNNKTVYMPYSSNWVYFVDNTPFANWAHPCRFIFVDESTGVYQIVNEDYFPADWNSVYITISEMIRPTTINLPVNTDATIEGLETNTNLYAVFIMGYEEHNQHRFHNDISAMYCTLLDVYGYTKENIFVHYANGTSIFGDDLDDPAYPSDDIDYDAVKGTIEDTFNEMSGMTNVPNDGIPELGPEDALFIFVDGHGYSEGGELLY